jgi:hypothetical protein
MHANQKIFRRICRNARPLERLNLLALALDLTPHPFDFCPECAKFHGWTLVLHQNKKRTFWQAARNGVPPREHAKARGSCATSRRKGEINPV